MDRIWQWAWDRYGPRYSWAVSAIGFMVILQIYLGSAFIVVALEGSRHYVEATVATVVTVVYVLFLPGVGPIRRVEQWAAGHEVDRATALGDTYAYGR